MQVRRRELQLNNYQDLNVKYKGPGEGMDEDQYRGHYIKRIQYEDYRGHYIKRVQYGLKGTSEPSEFLIFKYTN